MSHQVTVDFEGVSIKIQAQCESATKSLCKIDKTINLIRQTASKVETKAIKEYEQYLLDSKRQIQSQIDIVYSKLDEYKSLKRQVLSFNTQSKWINLNQAIRVEAQKLQNLANELTGSKLEVINQMVNDSLLDKIDELRANLLGIKTFDQDLLNKINSIDDVSLRELAFFQMNNGLSDFDLILSNAQKEYDKILGKSSVVEEIKEELKKSGISTEEIAQITSKPINAKTLNQITQEANDAIVDEKVRKETLKVIIKSIKDRGFIVDTKNNLKIDKKTNIVKLVAQKPDGKKAEFEISLNGKFMYHFDGYEGQACQKDITPFIDDLENIYDINILRKEVIWSNPDKIQAKKYQQINSNKNKN